MVGLNAVTFQVILLTLYLHVCSQRLARKEGERERKGGRGVCVQFAVGWWTISIYTQQGKKWQLLVTR